MFVICVPRTGGAAGLRSAGRLAWALLVSAGSEEIGQVAGMGTMDRPLSSGRLEGQVDERCELVEESNRRRNASVERRQVEMLVGGVHAIGRKRESPQDDRNAQLALQECRASGRTSSRLSSRRGRWQWAATIR